MHILSITWKDLKILARDRGTFIALFLSPLAFIVIMSLALGQTFADLNTSNPVKVLLVNNDTGGALASQYISKLETSAANTGGIVFEQSDPNGAALDDASAQQLIKERKRSIAVLIPQGFTDSIQQGQRPSVRFIADPGAPDQVVKPVWAMVEAVLAQTAGPVLLEHAVSDGLSTSLPSDAVQQIDQQVATAVDAEGSNTHPSVAMEAPAGLSAPKFPSVYQQNVPGYAIMYVFFIIATLAASIHKEKQDGTFRRLLAAPIGNAAMLAGKLLPYYIVNLIQIVVLFGIGAVVFKMDLGPHPLALVPISLLLSACAVSLGLLLATLSKNEAQANSMAPAIVIVLAAIGGCMVPPVVMPEFMTNLAHISPAGWALFGYQDVMVRGQDVLDTLPTLGVLAAYTVVLFGIATRRFRFN